MNILIVHVRAALEPERSNPVLLYCDNPRSKKFTADDLEVFTALCNYAAVAIEQGRLSLQLLEETRRRERLQRYHSPPRGQPHPARQRLR